MSDAAKPIPIEPMRGDAPPRTLALDSGTAAGVAFDLCAAGIAVAGDDGRIAHANAAMAAILGRTPAELVGRTLLELAHPDDRGAHLQRVVRLTTGDGHPPSLELRFLRPDGRTAWCRTQLRVADRGERGRAFVVTLVDVTERREAEARRLADAVAAERASRERAEGANRAKADFLAVLSHELRTPLNAIAGYAELLQLGIPERVPAAVTQHVARIQENEHHLQALVDSILGFAKLEAGRVEYDIADALVEDVLRALEGAMAPQLAARGLTLRLESSDARLRMRADPEKLGQVLRNLVGNAIKFSDRGEVIVTAEAGSDEGLGRVVRLHVRDGGCGIPGEQQEAIFRPFVQLTPRPSARAAGFGLGLAISREYARAMGGDLFVRSRVGQGSTFTVVLPEGGEERAEG